MTARVLLGNATVLLLVAAASSSGQTNPPAAAGASRQEPSVAPGAALNLAAFPFSREIRAGTPGLNAIALDAAVLAHAGAPGLADIRIAASSGQEIPYLLEMLDEPLSVILPPLEKATPPRGADDAGRRATGTRSHYRILLPYETLPASRLVLETTARVFERGVFVMAGREDRDAGRAGGARWVAGRRWGHADPETPAPALVLDLQPPGTRDLLLIIEEGDNQPLPLSPLRLLLPAFRLRFFRDTDASCLLLYGRKDLAPPRYDLALIAPRLVGAPAYDVELGPERSTPPRATGTLPPAVFWGALITAVVVLLLLVVRLLWQKP